MTTAGRVRAIMGPGTNLADAADEVLAAWSQQTADWGAGLMAVRSSGKLICHLASIMLGFGLATPSSACSYVRPSDAELARQRDAVAIAKTTSPVVVQGTWRPDLAKGGIYARTGTIFPTRILRGKKLQMYKARKAFPTDPCRNEDISLATAKTSTFYLARQSDGTFAILHFDALFKRP